MRTLKDVVKEHSPENVNEKYQGGVNDCPEDYPYLSGHYASDKCIVKKSGEIDCDKCWMQPYLIPEEEKNDREKIIEGAKIMRDVCIKNRTTIRCDNCSIFDICKEFDYASEIGAFYPEYIGELPEV